MGDARSPCRSARISRDRSTVVGATPPRFEIGRGEPGYPELLAVIDDPPERIFGIGDPEALVPSLGVVGARRATPYGLAATRLFAGWAARAGYCIVSGGARGCDQAAHEAALAEGALTVAVMGGGADVAYPRSSCSLFESIAQQGAVISEQPWGTRPQKWTFRARNRIIAGLSQVLLVAEASLPSGTFGTANFAAEAGRCVAAVPGSIFAPECRGSNRLIASGAQPVTDTSEFAALLRREIGEPPRQVEARAAAAGDVEGRDALLAAVFADPSRPDDLARSLGLDIVAVARRLGALEAQGVVAKYHDGRYGPC